MTFSLIALLIITGLILLAIELLLIPGFSVPGLAGITLIGYGIYKSSKDFGTTGVIATVLFSVIVTVLLVHITLRSRKIKALSLDYSQKGTTAVDDYSFLAGKEGKTLSILRSSGIALIDGKRYDVVTDGEFIEENTDIIVRKVEGARIIVSLNKRR